jgi:hypothetical protein
MKSRNAIILLLVGMAGGYLLGRRTEPLAGVGNHSDGQQAIAGNRVEQAVALTKPSLQQNNKSTDQSQTRVEIAKPPFTSDQLAGLRFEFLRSVAVKYADFIAKNKLPKEKAELFLELLVDQRMIGIEASVQTSDGPAQIASKDEIKAAYEKNEKLMTDVLGSDGMITLKNFDRASQQESNSLKAVAAVEEATPLANEARIAFSQQIQSFDPSGGVGDFIAPGVPITAAQEQTMRDQLHRNVEAILSKGILDPAQQAAFRKWSDDEFSRSLNFVKQIIDANIKTKKD